MKRSPKVNKKEKGAFAFSSPAEANLTITKELLTDNIDEGKAKPIIYDNGTINSSISQEISMSPTITRSADPNAWTKREVGSWLRSEGFSDYINLFERHNITGEVLLTLTEDDLRNPPLNMNLLGDIKLLNKSIQVLSGNYRPRTSSKGLVVPRERDLLDSRSEKKIKVSTPSFPFTMPTPEANTLSWSLGDKGSIPKLLFSVTYLLGVCFMTAFTMAIVHDRVPDQVSYPPLPDIFLDMIPPIDWAFEVCELIILFLGTVFVTTLLFHKHRLVILKRFCAIAGTVFFLRCITMFVTSLSVPGAHLKCDVRVGASLEEKLRYAWLLMNNLALSINGVRTCGDYMFSGHTSVVTLVNHFIMEYTPRNWKGFHSFCMVLNIGAMFLILAAHEHYSIDVLIAFFISSRLFLYYHSLANAVVALRGTERDRIQSFFPMFTYLEEHTDGTVPNEYEMPWSPLVRGLIKVYSVAKAKVILAIYKTHLDVLAANFNKSTLLSGKRRKKE